MVEYVGTRYAGFQRQPGNVTVQSTLEQAIADVTQHRAAVVGSGRTDAGAHAFRQVIAFGTESQLSADSIRRALNARLPRDIAITASCDVAEDFHPRHSAISRAYRYVIWNRPIRSPFYEGRAMHVRHRLDEKAMDIAASTLVGRRDMSAFVPVQAEGNREREIVTAGCRRDGDLVYVEIEASGFMRQMMRSIAGTLVRVGGGRISVEDFTRIVACGRRALAADTAPAAGLYLMRVLYGPESLTNNPSNTNLRLPAGATQETA